MPRTHSYTARFEWSGASAGPTVTYDAYSRAYTVAIPGKPLLTASADPAYRGDAALHNPEDLLMAAVGGCHMLSYLAQCALKGIEVLAYHDDASGTMAIVDRKMRFTEVTLRPHVTVAPGTDLALAQKLHVDANAGCFIANSVNFPVHHEAVIVEASE